MKDSPPSRHILVRGDKKLVVRTQPFYSVFFRTEPRQDDKLLVQVKKAAKLSTRRNRNKSGTTSCDEILTGDNKLAVGVIDDIPFSVNGTETARKNIAMFAAVFFAATVMGVLVFSYWARVMGGGDNPAAAFNPVLEKRAIVLSIMFVGALALMSVMSYELLTLKWLSRQWFLGSRKPEAFHSFLLQERRILIWAFLLTWLVVVVYTTAVLARRPGVFREQIITNAVAGVVLLVSQYLYHRAADPAVKTFALLVSVFVVGLLVVLLYAG